MSHALIHLCFYSWIYLSLDSFPPTSPLKIFYQYSFFMSQLWYRLLFMFLPTPPLPPCLLGVKKLAVPHACSSEHAYSLDSFHLVASTVWLTTLISELQRAGCLLAQEAGCTENVSPPQQPGWPRTQDLVMDLQDPSLLGIDNSAKCVLCHFPEFALKINLQSS